MRDYKVLIYKDGPITSDDFEKAYYMGFFDMWDIIRRINKEMSDSDIEEAFNLRECCTDEVFHSAMDCLLSSNKDPREVLSELEAFDKKKVKKGIEKFISVYDKDTLLEVIGKLNGDENKKF
jgi:hypothetical protein